MGASPWAKGSAISPSCRPAGSSARRTSPGEGIEVTACLPAAGATHACHVRTLRRRDVCRYLGPTLVCRPEKVLLPFAGCRLQTRAGLTPAVGVAPSRGLLLGSVSPLRGPARRSAPCVRADARQCRASRPHSPMADSPPQRIHALLYATPGPARPLPIHWRGIETAVHRSGANPKPRGNSPNQTQCFPRLGEQKKRETARVSRSIRLSPEDCSCGAARLARD